MAHAVGEDRDGENTGTLPLNISGVQVIRHFGSDDYFFINLPVDTGCGKSCPIQCSSSRMIWE
jgi:hypothetical protein